MTAASPTCVPGAVILGKYRVERIIGEGGMGFVLEATHLALGHQVAIKVLRNERNDRELVARFQREAQIAAQLKTDYVARVSDAGITGAGEPFLVMELLEGRTLEDEIRARGPLPVTEAVDFMLQACRGIAEAHAAGLVHRDIKPANLFVTRRRDGSVVLKVLDFGLSKAPDNGIDSPLTSTSTTFGTPQYMSPEQIRSAKHVDARTDQHALGCVLFECLVARPAYDAETLTAIAVKIATTMPDPPSSVRADVPRGLDAVFLRAVAKHPDDRFADFAALAAAMAPFGGPSADEAARSVATVLRGSSMLPPNESVAPNPGVRGWSEVMPSAPPHAAAVVAPPAGSKGVEPTITDDGPPLRPPRRAPTLEPPPRSSVTRTAPDGEARPARLLESPLVIVAAVLVSIFGIWLLVTLLRRPVAVDTSDDVADDDPPAAVSGEPATAPTIPPSTTATATATQPSAQPTQQPTQQPKKKRRHRH